MSNSHLPLAAIAAVLSTAPLTAGDADAFVSMPATAPTADSGWEFTFSPYAWAAGLDGTVGIGTVTADIDLSFSDILENLDIGAMGHFEARNGRWALLFDGLWLKLDSRAATPGPLYGGARVDVEELRLAAQVSYRALEGPTTLDLLAGLSYFSIDSDFALLPGTLAGGQIGTSEDWIDPIIGFHLRHELSERWFTMLRGEIGGFSVGSDLTWQAMAGVGYQTGDSSAVFLGYRHLDIDYDDNGFVYDTATSGFILGMNFSF
jgi:opacity protein-like surface antigen